MMPHDNNKNASSREGVEVGAVVNEVALVNMPFTTLSAPSIALGLLQSGLKRTGIPSKSLHFHFRFAELIGQDAYTFIEETTHPEHLVREWIFSESLFGHEKNRDLDGYVKEVLSVKTVSSRSELP